MKRLLVSILFLAIGAVLFQGFQCQTREMGSAKNYIKRGEHEKAIKSLNMEIKKNPKNVEAYILLAETKSYLKDYEGAANAILEAKEVAKLPNDKSRINNYIFTLKNRYDEEIRAKYNKYAGTNELKYIDSALNLVDIKLKLRPKMADSYRSKGMFLIVKGDTTEAIESYYKYIELMQEEIDFAKEHNIFLNAPRQNLVDAIGDTEKNISTNDSLKAEIFMNGEQPVYVVSQLTDNKFLILNWQVEPPQGWDLNEKFFGDDVSYVLFVIDRLINVEYSKENYTKVLELLNLAKQLDPEDPKTMESIVQVYRDMGRENEAFELLKKLTEKDPGNKYYWNEYGNLYFQKEDYDKALEMFQKALDIDPNYDTALLNAASTYINKAVIIYKEEDAKQDEDRKYQINEDAYFPFYKKAAENLEKVLELEDYQSDFTLLKELVIIYHNLHMEDKFQENLSKIKRMEYRITSEQSSTYFKTMMNLMGELSASFNSIQIAENPNEEPNEDENPYKKDYEKYKEKYKKSLN